MSGLTKEQYEQMAADCSGKCVISDDMLYEKPDLMKCVTCPFCRETVDAVLTPTTIRCPKCETTVSR